MAHEYLHTAETIIGGRPHMRGPSGRLPGWGNSQRWGLQGQSPSYSNYDVIVGAGASNVGNLISAGFHTMVQKLGLSGPTLNRAERASAVQNSLPAARYFNSYAGAGTGRSWTGGAVANVPRGLRLGWNPGMQGAAELHPATTYDPYPSPSQLYPKVV